MYEQVLNKFQAWNRMKQFEVINQGHLVIFARVPISSILSMKDIKLKVYDQHIRFMQSYEEHSINYLNEYIHTIFRKPTGKWLGNVTIGFSKKGFYIHLSKSNHLLEEKYWYDYLTLNRDVTIRIKSYDELMKYLNLELKLIDRPYIFEWYSDNRKPNMKDKLFEQLEQVSFLIDQM